MPVNSHAVAQSEMISFFLANLPAGFTAGICQLPNAPFTTPNNSKWLRVSVIPLQTVNTVATGCRQRTTGIFVVDVFYPLGTGDAAALATAEFIRQTLTNTATDNVMLYESHIEPVNDSRFYMLQVTTNYSHEGFTHA